MIRHFGTTTDGRDVSALTLQAGQLRVVLLTWGAVIQDVRLAGVPWSLVLGTDVLAGYEGVMDYFGAIVGPVANRIANATAEIDGQRYQFEANNGPNTLHGGTWGSQRQIWDIADHGPDHATLTVTLPDGAGGFPGNRQLRAEYRLEAPATLTLRLTAETDAPTLMNLATHGYWNLDGRGTIEGHVLQVAADHYLPTEGLIPTNVTPVSGPFDLRQPRALTLGEGLDHNFCLADAARPLTFAAALTGTSGTRLVLETTEPGLQVYDGEHIDTRPFPGHAGQPYGPHAGIALEPQLWPDAPNRPDFASTLLRPGETYRQESRFTLSRPALPDTSG